jgi:hypothetical protein
MADSVNMAECFYYPNPANGDEVTKALLEDYVKLIGLRACALVTSVGQQQNIIASFAERLSTLEGVPAVTLELPSLYPSAGGIGNPNTLVALDTFTAQLEEQFAQLRSATGTVDNIALVISAFSGLNSSKALGTTGGNLSSLSGWVQQVVLFTDIVNNFGLMIQDLRNAVQNIKLSCCTGSCNSVEVSIQTLYAARILTLYFSGTIPSNLVNGEASGTLFTIIDQSGNSITKRIDIKGNMDSSVAIDLTSAPLNFSDDLKLSGILSLVDQDNGSMCQKYIEKTISNTTACPTMTINSNFTSLTYTFTHIEGTLTYQIQLWSMNNVLLASHNVSVSSAITIQNTFLDLDSGTSYKLRIQMITSENTRSCPFVTATTLETPCPAPTSVTAEITY